jgi:hypothetical protein
MFSYTSSQLENFITSSPYLPLKQKTLVKQKFLCKYTVCLVCPSNMLTKNIRNTKNIHVLLFFLFTLCTEDLV